MKKILFGLIATSMVSYAAAPTLTNPATEDTNVFQTGQQGKITVNGNLSSDVPPVRYVVYASVDGRYDGTAGETWQIPTWVIEAKTGSAPTGVGPNGSTDVSSIPKIYVKRVNADNNGVIDLGASEIAEFKIQLPSDYNQNSWNGTTGLVDYMTSGNTSNLSIFTFFSKATLTKMMTEIGATNPVVSSYDNSTKQLVSLFGTQSEGGYMGGSYFSFKADNSVFSLATVAAYSMSSSVTTYLADAKKVDNYFATERTISPEVVILVQIGSK